jgi:amino acid permease
MPFRLGTLRGLLVLSFWWLFWQQSASCDALVSPKGATSAARVVGNTRLNTRTAVATKNTADSSSSSSSSTGTATIPDEVFNLVKSIVGAGVLSLPYGVAVFGNAPSALVPACALIAVMGTVSAYTFGLIGRVCQRTDTNSYADAWDATVGTSTSWLIAFSCFIDCFAGNLSYSMILSDTIVNLAAAAGLAVTRTHALLGVTGLVLFPLCRLQNLASLAPFSLVGIAGMLYTTLAMGLRWSSRVYQPGGAYYATQLAPPVFGTAGAAAAWSSPRTLILACMLSNAFIAHFNAPKFLAELKDNTMTRFHKVIGWSFATSIALYALITSFGFLTFGAAANGLILNNYSAGDALASISRIAVAISITCSYPLIFAGSRDGLLDLFKIPMKQRDQALVNKATMAILTVVTVMASQLRDLGIVAAVGGATFGTALVFVYPAVMFLKTQAKRTRETIPAAAIGVLGVIMGGIGTVFALQGGGGH